MRINFPIAGYFVPPKYKVLWATLSQHGLEDGGWHGDTCTVTNLVGYNSKDDNAAGVL